MSNGHCKGHCVPGSPRLVLLGVESKQLGMGMGRRVEGCACCMACRVRYYGLDAKRCPCCGMCLRRRRPRAILRNLPRIGAEPEAAVP